MIANRVVVHTFANGNHYPRALMAQNQGQWIGNSAVGGRQVAVAYPARGHADRHLAVLRVRHFNLFDDDGLADFARQNCLRKLSH